MNFTPMTVKQFVTACRNKCAEMRIFNDGTEVDYDDMASYKDLYIIGFDILVKNGNLIILVDVSKSVEVITYPYFE